MFPLMLLSRLFDTSADKDQPDDIALEKRVKFPKVLNWIFDLFMRVDEMLIKLGLSLPFGGTLLVVAIKKPGAEVQPFQTEQLG